KYNISEVVYMIGYSSRSYFSKIFKNKYGISPSKYVIQLKKQNIA
ncbi:MAG: AraC family transcriptional regulator, partial [Flavobacteriaceae bacterium]|nr:AraC family transcriptional regulator [Flavobacteriaceae bacterium]